MKKELKVWAMTCIAFWCLVPNSSQSQDSVQFQTLSEVVVTASKFPKSSAQTGKVLLVIDSTALQRSGGKDLAQVLGEQAGVYINGANSNAGKDKAVYIRGAATHHSLILVDGIPVADPSGVNGALDLRLLPLGSVERIEILKGSQSTLYGTAALGGVINIITKKGTDRSQFLEALVGYGTYDTWDARVSATARLGENASLTAGINHYRSAGFSEARDSLDTGTFDEDPYSSTSAYLNMKLSPLPGLEILPFYSYSSVEGDYDMGAFSDDTLAVFKADLQHAGLRAGYQTGRSTLSVMLSANRSDRRFSSAFGDFEALGTLAHAETVWKYEAAPHLDLVTGLSVQRMSLDDTEIGSMYLTGPYASVHYSKNKFGMEGGLRLNHHSEYGTNWTFSLNPYWRAGRWKLFANAGSGFRAPTLNQLFGQFGPNPGLNPETSLSYEGGVVYFTRDMNVRIVYFDRTIEDMIIYTSRYENVDQQHVRGVEIEPEWKVNEELSFSGYYALMDGEVTTRTPEGDSTYADLIRKPRHAAGLTADWQPVSRLALSVRYRWYGSRDDRFFSLSTFTTETVSLDPYDLLDVYLEYHITKGVRAFVNGQNLLDTQYEEVYGYNVRGRTLTVGVRAGI